MAELEKNVNKVDVENTYSERLIDFFDTEYRPLESLCELAPGLDCGDELSVAAFIALVRALNDSFIKTMTETIKQIENNVGDIQILRATKGNKRHWEGTVLNVEIPE
jgi:hypothetical protein